MRFPGPNQYPAPNSYPNATWPPGGGVGADTFGTLCDVYAVAVGDNGAGVENPVLVAAVALGAHATASDASPYLGAVLTPAGSGVTSPVYTSGVDVPDFGSEVSTMADFRVVVSVPALDTDVSPTEFSSSAATAALSSTVTPTAASTSVQVATPQTGVDVLPFDTDAVVAPAETEVGC